MEAKIIITHLKNKGFTILDDMYKINEVSIISAFNKETSLIIVHTVTNGRTEITYKTTTDVRFLGRIKNIQQLNMILELVKVD